MTARRSLSGRGASGERADSRIGPKTAIERKDAKHAEQCKDNFQETILSRWLISISLQEAGEGQWSWRSAGSGRRCDALDKKIINQILNKTRGDASYACGEEQETLLQERNKRLDIMRKSSLFVARLQCRLAHLLQPHRFGGALQECRTHAMQQER